MQNKTIGLIAVLILVVGAIAYLETGKSRPLPSVAPGESDIPLDVAIRNQSGASSTPIAPEGEAMTEPSGSLATATVPTAPTTAAIPDRIAAKAKEYDRAKEISTPDGFINLPPGQTDLKLADLIGKKVVLVDFWTYSCINCERTTPYLNAWYQKYRDHGLEIVGIHTPEFDFEKNYDNVLAAVKKEGIQYPVVLDNDYSTWFAYQNRYWPRKYLIDIDGFIVYDHIGEGGYAEMEQRIQAALAERDKVLGITDTIPGGIVNPSGTYDTGSAGPRSPETYFGSDRNAYLGNGSVGMTGNQMLTEPTTIAPSVLYLAGKWQFEPEYATNEEAGATIVYRYQAKNVYFVAAGPSGGVRVRVLRDGVPIGQFAGKDVDADGYVTIEANRLYELVAEPDAAEHTLELIIEKPGLQAFTFTFG
jgi:thiol-disulfide isomerase/thioredoxin